jgi:hypothetical protein
LAVGALAAAGAADDPDGADAAGAAGAADAADGADAAGAAGAAGALAGASAEPQATAKAITKIIHIATKILGFLNGYRVILVRLLNLLYLGLPSRPLWGNLLSWLSLSAAPLDRCQNIRIRNNLEP